MSELGHTLPADEMTGEIAEALAIADAPRHHEKLSPGQWVKRNLFNSKLNTVITVVLTPIIVYLLYRAFMFVFVNGQWEPVRANLELFMVGLYPREERWRLVAQVLLLGATVGMAVGLGNNRARATAVQTGQPRTRTSWHTYLASYWAIGLFVIAMLAAFTRTIGPTLLAIGTLCLAVLGYLITFRLPAVVIPYAWTFAGIVGAVSFQVLSGTGGWAWAFTTLALFPAARAIATALPAVVRLPIAIAGLLVGVATLVLKPGTFAVVAVLVGLFAVFTALRGDRIDAARLGLVMMGGAVVYLVYSWIGLEGVDWKDWGGLQLNLVVASASIILAFPLGILLAMGRRSSLPAVKTISVIYIEFFRGAPLITFLLAAAYFLGFFLDSDSPLSLVTRAIAAVTLFSAAYVAEIVRGGLNAVQPGQVEAGQAVGLSGSKVTRLIVLPQALRAVIPAMVGQFISLFKDTTLLSIIGITEFLGVRTLVHAQAEFRTIGIAETLVFVAFGFWAFSFTMSRESQRLERRLGVGQR